MQQVPSAKNEIIERLIGWISDIATRDPERLPGLDNNSIGKHDENTIHFDCDRGHFLATIEDGKIVLRDATLPDDPEILFNYSTPEKLEKLLFTADRRHWNRYFFNNIDALPQAIAALVFVKLRTEHGLLQSGTTLWVYCWAPAYCYRPMADITKPALLAPAPFLQTESEVIRHFGSDFTIDTENGKKIRRHYKRGRAPEITLHFFQYCELNLVDDRAFLHKKPDPVVSCADGIIDLRTGSIEPHGPEHKMTIPSFPYKYSGKISKEAQAKFEKYFTNLAAEEDEENFLVWLPWIVGYTLTPWRLKIAFIFIGANDAGKTTFIEQIENLHRATNTAKKVNFSKMASRPGDFDYEPFEETLVAIHDDFEPGGLLPAEQIKEIANKNTTITVNKKFKPPVSRINCAAPIIGANSDPKSKDPYISNRIVGTTFTRTFNQTPENSRFIQEIESMDEELFNIGVKALVEFFKNGANLETILPRSVKETTARIVEGLNDALEWISEQVGEGLLYTGTSYAIPKKVLYELYYKSRGPRAVGRNSFYAAVSQQFRDHKGHRERVFLGIGRATDIMEATDDDLPF